MVSALVNYLLYGDRIFEKHGINRDAAGMCEKTRYFNGKQDIFNRDRPASGASHYRIT